MSTIVTRASKGSALTWTEGDANITNLNNDKMENFTVAGDSGTSQTVSGGNTLTISGGTGLSSVASATDVLTINLDNTAVVAGSYTYASITVDAQGRLTAASNGTTPLTSGGALGTPSSGTLTNATGLPVGTGISGLGTGVATFLATPSSANLISAVTDETGTGALVFATSPTLVTPALGTPSSGTVTNLTGTASININGTVGATTANTGAFTTLSASSTVSGTGFSTYLASPPAIGGTTAAAITGTTITANTQFSGPHNGTVGATTANTGAFTTLSASSTVSGTGFSTYLASPPAIGGTAPAAGTFTAITSNGSITFKDPREATYDNGNSGAATITPNAANGSVQKYTLTGNITWNAFGSPAAGQSITMILIQDGTGSRTLTSTIKWAGASKTLSTAASSIDIATVYYDGTNYYGSLAKGFA